MARFLNNAGGASDIIQNTSNMAKYTVASGTAGGWMKTTFNVTGTQGAIFARLGVNNSNGFFFLQNSTNHLEFACWDQSSVVQVDLSDTVVDLHDGNWHHLVGVFDTGSGNSNTIYVDGVSRGSVNSSAVWTMSSTANTPTIQWGGTGPPGGWTRIVTLSVAEWFFCSAKLTALEVQGLYRGQRPWGLRSGISWWPLDGDNSTEPDMFSSQNVVAGTNATKTFGAPFTLFTPRWPRDVTPTSIPALTLMPQIVM